MVIKRIDPMSFAKIFAVIYAVIGLLMGVLFALIGSSLGGGMMGSGFGVGAIILFPILYGGIGFIANLIVAAIYNLVAGWVGGVRIDVE